MSKRLFRTVCVSLILGSIVLLVSVNQGIRWELASRGILPIREDDFANRCLVEEDVGASFKGLTLSEFSEMIEGVDLSKVSVNDNDVFASVLKYNQSGVAFDVWRVNGRPICILVDAGGRVIEVRVIYGG